MLDFFLSEVIYPPWPCYSGAFQRVSSPASSFRCKWFFQGTFLNFYLNPFFLSEFAGFKNINMSIVYTVYIRKTCINPVGGGVGWSLSRPSRNFQLRMQVFLWRTPLGCVRECDVCVWGFVYVMGGWVRVCLMVGYGLFMWYSK